MKSLSRRRQTANGVAAGTHRPGTNDIARYRHGRITKLTASADGYLLTVRESLRRQAEMLQLHTKIGLGLAAFLAHMSDRSTADWTNKAVQLQNSLEQDYRESQRTLEAQSKIADSLPDALKALEKLAPEGLLITL